MNEQKRNTNQPRFIDEIGYLCRPVAQNAGNSDGAGSPSLSGVPPQTLWRSTQLVTRWWLVIGTAVADWFHTGETVIVDEHSLSIHGARGWEVVLYHGPKIQLGEQRTTAMDLDPVVTRLGAKRIISGGNINTARELDRLRKIRALPFKIGLVDTGTPSAELRENGDELFAEYFPISLGKISSNLVIVNERGGLPRRTVLTSQVSPFESFNGKWPRAIARLESNLEVVIVNSARSDAVAKAGVQTARRSGALLVTVLTPSTSVDCRLHDLLANSDASVANLADFRELVALFGFDCPGREHFSSVPGVAEAMSKLIDIIPCGHLAITMGESGVVLYDSHRGVIAHVGLIDEARAICRNYLSAARIEGIGDAFVANLTVALKFLTSTGSESYRVIPAVRRAWMELLEGSNPRFLHPREGWFAVWVISTGLVKTSKGL